MGLFGFGKKKDVIDLTERYQRDEKLKEKPSEQGNNFSFLANLAGGQSQTQKPLDSDYADLTANSDDKKQKIAKRLLDMTNKIEDLSNQIYHLSQRIELLERKTNIKSVT